MNTSKPWALITGASGGIGLELTRLEAADGYNLLLVARDGAGLSKVAADLAAHDRQIDVLAVDLGLPGAAAKVAAWVGERPVELLINNAGFATHGAVAEMDQAELASEIGVNVTTLTELSRLMLPGM